MISLRRIDHVQVCVPPDGEERAREFYGDLLGLAEIPKPQSLRANGGSWYRSGDVELHVGVEPETDPSRRHPAFEVADVDAAREYLEANGVRTKDDTPIPDRSRFSFYDPWDNRIELLAYDE